MRLLSLMLLSLACGGGVGPSKFTGTVSGNALDVKDSVFVAGTEVWLSSSEGLCKNLQNNTLPKAGKFTKLIFHPVATGAFTVDPSTSTGKDHTVFVQFFKLDDTCTNTLTFGASVGTAGTLTVANHVAAKNIDGTFEVTFGTADQVTGSFNATYCDAGTTYPSPECK